ncbi:MAG: type I restriction enzyme HsdR N-terminal domain-containing protein [Bacteroidaceae bacterium]|nr:type I restriction enzyme HsdR N-terminal domain-containing protein [Bacteroidaceae bacterium]
MKRLTERIESLKANLQTEEATKTALIMPFISALGYDVFNPLEVLPEMCCDIGTKKGEKIDYAILKDGEPIILVECKHWQQNLTLHDNQLLRYFHVSKAKFGVLTNGIIYRFYTDLAEPNKMDEKPFLEVNLLDIKEEQIEELKKFHKSYYDVEEILSTASELKYMGELRTVIEKEFTSPSPDLVKFLGKQVYEGVFTPKVLEQFTALLKRTIQNYINTTISDRLKAAINDHETIKVETPNVEVTEPVVEDIPANKIVTTEEEIEAFYIIKAILRDTIATERVTYRDAQSYFAIFIDNNNRKPVCRLYLNSETNKKITFVGEDKKEQHNKINSLDEIYQYSDQLIEAAKRFV